MPVDRIYASIRLCLFRSAGKSLGIWRNWPRRVSTNHERYAKRQDVAGRRSDVGAISCHDLPRFRLNGLLDGKSNQSYIMGWGGLSDRPKSRISFSVWLSAGDNGKYAENADYASGRGGPAQSRPEDSVARAFVVSGGFSKSKLRSKRGKCFDGFLSNG